MTERSIGDDPFATPAQQRTPARRFRGALAGPVTIWTSGSVDEPRGLTVSSILVAEGEPALVLGLLSDTSDLWDAIGSTGTFVVHILPADRGALADVFAGIRPHPGGPFSGLETSDSEHGPLIVGLPDRVHCRVADVGDRGFQKLVTGSIEKIELDDPADPMIHYRGRYRRLVARG